MMFYETLPAIYSYSALALLALKQTKKRKQHKRKSKKNHHHLDELFAYTARNNKDEGKEVYHPYTIALAI